MLKQVRFRFLTFAICATFAFLAIFSPVKAWAIPVAPVSVLLQINRVAGSPAGTAGVTGDAGPALGALLSQPEGVSIDGAGNLYIADTSNNRIRRIDAATGIITTVAGNGSQGYSGDGGLAANATLDQPSAVLVDAHGNFYIADTGNNIVRFVNINTGIITTVAGTYYTDAFSPGRLGDGGLATSAELDIPTALAVDTAGNLYIADSGDNRIRIVSATTGFITTVAGTGAASYSGDGGLATAATLNQPTGIGVDAANNLYIADSGNNVIREVTASNGDIATVAGIGSAGAGADGTATLSALNFPTGLAVDMAGQVYFSDRGNNRIRKLDIANPRNVVTLAGTGIAGLAGDAQLAATAKINQPGGLALDPAGDLYVADSANSEIRLVSTGLGWTAAEIATPTPVIHTIFLQANLAEALTTPTVAKAENNKQEFTIGAIAGTGCTMDGATSIPSSTVCDVPVTFTPAYPGERTGAFQLTANATKLSLGLYGIGLGPQVVLVPGIIQGILNSADMFNGIPLQKPEQMVTDPAGNVYVADPTSNVVWALTNTDGAAPTIVAGGGSLLADGVQAVDAELNQPKAVTLDAAGNLYIAEAGANRVRKVNLASGIITTVAGNGTAGPTGDGGPATNAELNNPSGIAVDATGDLFIADTGNNKIRRVYALTGTIVTIAGTGTAGATGDLGFAVNAELNAPQGVAVDAVGQLYIADTANNVVRKVDPVTGIITTIAGNKTAGFSGDLGAATGAELNQPTAVAVDAAGNLYIADTNNARIRKVYAANENIVTIAGSALVGDAGDGGSATAAAMAQPSGVCLDPSGQILISDQSNATVRRVSPDTPTLDFGSETVGGTTAAQTDFLSNIGNQPLVISEFPAAPVPQDFPMASDAAQCTVSNLAVGGLCDLSFVFHPSIAGPITEDAVLTDNSLNAAAAQQAVVLTGNGVADTMVATTTTVSLNPTTAIYGTPVVLTATVATGTGPVPSGNVTFSINGIEAAGAQLNGSGVATVTLLAAPTGTDVVTASFAAQGNYDASSSGQATLVVTPANSQIVLTASTQQIRLGQNVIFTANVTSATTGIPTGNVEFLNGTAQIGEAILNASGQAIFNTQNLPAGTDTITAQYLGDANFQTSTSSPVVVTVADDTLTMTVTPTQMSIPGGKTGQATVTLTPKNGFAGTVNLSCAGLIQGATCQFSAPTATFVAQTQTPQTFTLVINPNTVATAGFGFPSGKSNPLIRLLLLLLTLGAALLVFRARKRSIWIGLGRALLVVFCIGLCTLSGCTNLAPAAPVMDAITVQASMPSTGVITSVQMQVNMAQ